MPFCTSKALFIELLAENSAYLSLLTYTEICWTGGGKKKWQAYKTVYS